MVGSGLINERKPDSGDAAAAASVINTAMSQGGDFLKQLVQLGMTNGLSGAVLDLIVIDILFQQKIITQTTYNVCLALVVGSVGLDLTGKLLSELESLVPFAKPAGNSVAVPTVTTLLQGGATTDTLAALIPKLAAVA